MSDFKVMILRMGITFFEVSFLGRIRRLTGSATVRWGLVVSMGNG